MRILQYLTAEDEQLLLGKATKASFANGDVIVAEGTPTPALYILEEGTARVEASHLGKGVTVAQLAAPDVFGEMSFLEKAEASATVVAEGPVEAFIVEVECLESLVADVPGFGSRFYQSLAVLLSARLRETTAHLPPVLVEEVAQVTRFHASRASSVHTAVLPVEFMDVIEAFKSTMVVTDGALKAGQLDDARGRETVAEACTLVSDTLQEQVQRLPSLENELGGYAFRETFPYFMQSPLLDRSFSKPRGYAGDFATIDLIYANEPEGPGKLAPLIDAWALGIPSAAAVRARRGMLVRTIRDEAARLNGPLRLTSLASGPARELFDVLTNEAPDLRAVCVDIDTEALAFAASVARELGVDDRITFAQDNILRLIRGRGKTALPPQHFIYSLGLIDYLDDRVLAPLLDWIHDALEPGGLAVIGNFGPGSPDKAYLDHILEWRLIYRDAERLRELFAQSRFANAPVDVIPDEAHGIQLFAFCRKD